MNHARPEPRLQIEAHALVGSISWKWVNRNHVLKPDHNLEELEQTLGYIGVVTPMTPGQSRPTYDIPQNR